MVQQQQQQQKSCAVECDICVHGMFSPKKPENQNVKFIAIANICAENGIEYD